MDQENKGGPELAKSSHHQPGHTNIILLHFIQGRTVPRDREGLLRIQPLLVFYCIWHLNYLDDGTGLLTSSFPNSSHQYARKFVRGAERLEAVLLSILGNAAEKHIQCLEPFVRPFQTGHPFIRRPYS